MDSTKEHGMLLLANGVQVGLPLDERTSQTQIGDASMFFSGWILLFEGDDSNSIQTNLLKEIFFSWHNWKVHGRCDFTPGWIQGLKWYYECSLYHLPSRFCVISTCFLLHLVTPGTSRLTFYHLSNPNVKRAHLFPDNTTKSARANAQWLWLTVFGSHGHSCSSHCDQQNEVFPVARIGPHDHSWSQELGSAPPTLHGWESGKDGPSKDYGDAVITRC